MGRSAHLIIADEAVAFEFVYKCFSGWFISGLQVRKPVASRRRLLAFAVQTVQQGLRVTSGGQI